MEQTRIFNIERFATEDGKGIRTVVFLKGCGLRCRWCANPESQAYNKEVIFNANLCINCEKCINICKQKAISFHTEYGYITNSNLCIGCGECVEGCYSNARTLAGTDYFVEELVGQIMKDEQYFKKSGGGVTFSGGEPLLHSRFIKECMERLKEHQITSLIETCGHVALEHIMEVAPLVDYVFYDIKHIDPIKHKALTGKDNKLILSNLKWLTENFTGELSVRYPYIPGCNHDEEAIKQFMDYLKTLKNIFEVVFLPYHRLGLPKYLGLGRKYEMGELKSLKKNELTYLIDTYKNYGLNIKVQ
ncbi:MAG: glycyl-radical enzyme activating protein [Firmicutes bacterium HGW-Firmicutes-7]|nr:MAG: glycyl-radical enzyme activating protein [Firmicutes bacterium HGW-Firmicutes-7]